MATIQLYFNTTSIVKEWKKKKATYLALILNEDNALEPCHVRLISLIMALYKIVAKLMVNRMKPLLTKLVTHEQDAFVGD